MMQARATAKGIRIAPRKVRLVLDNVRKKDVSTALAILQNTPRNSSPVIYKLIQSAVANAMNRDSSADVDEMVIKEAYANEASTLKRFRPRAMGRASRIHKRSSHITIVVESAN
tara:strand:+ start:39 stop:380 length:342 start_codon:yes stop_codon:yes gene_type:complete